MERSDSSVRTVFCLEDNESLRLTIQEVLQSKGYVVKSFVTASDLLAALADLPHESSGAMIGLFDMRLAGSLSGLDVFHSVRRLSPMPIIFLSGESRVSEAIAALKAGAYDFLLKPVDMVDLLDKIRCCFVDAESTRNQQMVMTDVRPEMFGQLTPREGEVLRLVLTGHRGGEIARQLGITERTVKMHRSNVMKKVNARNLAQLAALYQQHLADQTRLSALH
jgi:FixJ family two-component response regulator